MLRVVNGIFSSIVSFNKLLFRSLEWTLLMGLARGGFIRILIYIDEIESE